MSGIVLRDAGPADVAQILRFICEFAEYEKLSHEVRATPDLLMEALFGPQPRAEALIAAFDDEPVGYAMWLYKFNSFACRSSLFVEDIYIRPSHRGCGMGRAIFRHLADRAMAATCGRMEWVVLDWNSPAIAFYRSLGATPVPGWTTYGIAGPALAALAA